MRPMQLCYKGLQASAQTACRPWQDCHPIPQTTDGSGRCPGHVSACRLCQPFITEEGLKTTFGEASSQVYAYITMGPYGRFEFRPGFDR